MSRVRVIQVCEGKELLANFCDKIQDGKKEAGLVMLRHKWIVHGGKSRFGEKKWGFGHLSCCSWEVL